jgi:hypothetical protein
MSIRGEMHSLAQEITGSCEARIGGVAQIRNGTRTQLGEFHSALQAMSRRQRADLRKGRADLGKVRSDLSRGHNRLINSVHAQLQELATEHAGAREEWQKMATTIQAKRAGATAVAEVPAQKAPAEKAQKRAR